MLTLPQLQAIMPRLPAERAAEYLPHLNAAMEEFGISATCGRCGAGIVGANCARRQQGCQGGASEAVQHPDRMAAFLAHIAHESGEFRYMEEIWGPTEAQKRYERPVFDGKAAPLVTDGKLPLWQRLGNTERGDGVKFKGRGPIQLTGRANYRAASLALFPPSEAMPSSILTVLEWEPNRLLEPAIGFRVAAWFWATKKAKRAGEMSVDSLNAYSDAVDKVFAVHGGEAQARSAFDAITRAINGGLNGADQRWAYYLRAREALGLGVP